MRRFSFLQKQGLIGSVRILNFFVTLTSLEFLQMSERKFIPRCYDIFVGATCQKLKGHHFGVPLIFVMRSRCGFPTEGYEPAGE